MSFVSLGFVGSFAFCAYVCAAILVLSGAFLFVGCPLFFLVAGVYHLIKDKKDKIEARASQKKQQEASEKLRQQTWYGEEVK